jgi:hypothetical protein
MRVRFRSTRAATVALTTLLLCSAAPPALAQDADVASDIRRLEAMIRAQQTRIDAQQAEIEALRKIVSADELVTYRGMGYPGGNRFSGIQNTPPPPPSVDQDVSMPDTPVGERQAVEADTRIQAAAVPQEQGVLTPRGRLVFDPALEYSQSATDRLVFRGFELIPGIQVGLIEASKARRDTFVSSINFRYGITSRLEIDGRMPFVHRYDRIEVAQQRDEGIVRSISLDGNDIGDVEFGARYQLNDQKGQNPIWIAGLRVKSDTGKGPFSIGYDDFGVATGLATGSGFWGIQPSLNMLLPSDPVVIFGGLSYLAHLPRNIDRNVGGAMIGRVDPGDAISGNLGFGFALNPRFSYSMGYRHSYIFETSTEIGGAFERSRPLQIGSLTFGMSYRIDPKSTLNVSFEIGATEDAPDIGITMRAPWTF